MSLFLRLLVISFFSSSVSQLYAEEDEANIYVHPEGNDTNLGTKAKPKQTVESALEAIRDYRDKGIITERTQVNVWLRGGRYELKETIGIDFRNSGTAEKPLRISSAPGERAILDGNRTVDLRLFRKPDAEDKALLPENAHDSVVVATIPEGELSRGLASPDAQMSFGGKMLRVARFPNVGFSYVSKTLERDKAKAVGTKQKPLGVKIRLNPAPSIDLSQQIAELNTGMLKGYLGAAWLKEEFHLASGDGSVIKLQEGTKYGFPRPTKIGRVYLEDLPALLDEPGEWYYNPDSKKLYIWPSGPLGAESVIGLWDGPEAFHLSQCNYVSIERITIENLGRGRNGDGAITMKGGTGNRVKGCTIRNIASPLTVLNIIDGSNNGMLSCDIYDSDLGCRLYGGSATATEIVHGKNFIENCQFTQLYSRSFYGGVCGMKGAGNIFRNNLCHNHNGQIITVNGPENLLERNEIFNSGIEEGDGGTIYQGASFTSWGNRIQHNFFHHIICIPKVYTRAAIFSDDEDMGDEVVGNVFFKAGEGFKINGGSGHYAQGNICIENVNAMHTVGGRDPKGKYKSNVGYLNGNITSRDKDNHIGKGMPSFGKEGWRDGVNSKNWLDWVSPFWLDRFPRMRKVFETWERQKSMPMLNVYEDTIIVDCEMRVHSDSKVKGTSSKSIRSFKDSKVMNFSLRSKAKSDDGIPFDEIGLYKDEFRPNPPNKDAYRKEVKEHWSNTTSAAPGGYNPDQVNKRSYLNTGLIVVKHTPKK